MRGGLCCQVLVPVLSTLILLTGKKGGDGQQQLSDGSPEKAVLATVGDAIEVLRQCISDRLETVRGEVARQRVSQGARMKQLGAEVQSLTGQVPSMRRACACSCSQLTTCLHTFCQLREATDTIARQGASPLLALVSIPSPTRRTRVPFLHCRLGAQDHSQGARAADEGEAVAAVVPVGSLEAAGHGDGREGDATREAVCEQA